ncbi:hypothetical protein NVP2275O_178 [Vibrio phage 2.275.O._10N.286.54.E11]|nr:hypothetical protein NVP2275O_178 [Vibrio phage 2.275.O._10N.286.54.E11]
MNIKTTIEMLDGFFDRIKKEERMDQYGKYSEDYISSHTTIAWHNLAQYLSGDTQGGCGD